MRYGLLMLLLLVAPTFATAEDVAVSFPLASGERAGAAAAVGRDHFVVAARSVEHVSTTFFSVDQGQVRKLGGIEGTSAGRIRFAERRGRGVRLVVSGGCASSAGVVYCSRMVEIDDGLVTVTWDSLDLPAAFHEEESILACDRKGATWAAVARGTESSETDTVEVRVGDFSSTTPRWTSTLRFSQAPPPDVWFVDSLDVAVLSPTRVAVLARGLVFLVAKEKGARGPVLRPASGQGSMISFDEETRTLWVSERYNRDVSVFLVDRKPDHEMQGRQSREADFSLPESLLGAPVPRPFTVGPGRLAHAGGGPALKIFAFDERGFRGVKETAALPTDPRDMCFDTDLLTLLWSSRDAETDAVTFYRRKLERVAAR